MGFRFFRRMRIAPGVYVNFGKTGASVSVGPRGAKVTIGKRGVKSSVGIPGAGIRYETPYRRFQKHGYSGGGGDMANGGRNDGWFCISGLMSMILTFITVFAYNMYAEGGGGSFWLIAMLVSGVGALAALLHSLVSGLDGSAHTNCSVNSVASRKTARLNVNITDMINASKKLFAFLGEVNRSTRCRNQLRELPGMEAIDRGGNSFSLNKRLAAIVYCDLRSCFRKLGYDEGRLTGLAGIGYAMMILLLFDRDFDLNRFCDLRQRDKLLSIVSELKRTAKLEVDIEGHENEFRFVLIFGAVNHEQELVQRFATHLYRWASLIAKADGTVTKTEGEALQAIMMMTNRNGSDGNVRVSGGVAPSTDDIDLFAESAIEDKPANRSHADHEATPRTKTGLEAVMQKLDELIGLEQVKKEVRQLTNFIEIQHKRKERGLKVAPVTYHCVFTGNPGTGKTTVARILADIFRELGVVKKGHLVETDRSGLVAEYVGQTAVKTNKVIDSALDGVLFIDEAYTLVQGGDRDYGGEAIATLLKRMEDDRGRLVVVLAGYTEEMKKFINSNPGLQSRFNRYIEFPDYAAEELARIFLMNAEKNQYTCDKDVRASIVNIMEAAVQNKDVNFGNARYVRNLFEKAIQRQAVRLASVAPITTDMLSELTLHDLGFAYED